jgi:hypothetical protein
LAYELDTGTTKATITYTVNNSILIGAEAGTGTAPTGDYFTGKIAEVMLWNVCLTDALVADLYAALQTIYADFASITPLPISVFAATHAPPVFAAFASVTPLPVSVVAAEHIPNAASFASVTPVPTSVFIVWHDWTRGINPYRDAKIFQIRLEKTGMTPLILPVTNVSVRASLEGRQSSITCTVPLLDQVDAIAARASGGQLVFAGGYKVNGTARLNDLLTLPFTDARPDEGTKNKSLTLTANGPSPVAIGKTVTVRSIEYQSINGLKRLIRLPVDVNLYPGDTVDAGTATWTAGEVVYALGEGGESMTVTEA